MPAPAEPAAPAADPFGNVPAPAEQPVADPFGPQPAAEPAPADPFGKGADNSAGDRDIFGSLTVESGLELSNAQVEPKVDDLTDLLTAPAPAVETTAQAEETTEPEAAAPVAQPVVETKAVETQVAASAEPDAPAANDEFPGTEVRKWRDNTGTFEVTGRLVVVMPDKVRLLKDNGRFTTVPMRRLSNEDRQYVEQTLAKKNSQSAKFISTK